MKFPERKENPKKYKMTSSVESGNPSEPNQVSKTVFELVQDFSNVLKDVLDDSTTRSIINDYPKERIRFVDLVEYLIEPGILSGIISNFSMLVGSMPKPDVIVSPESRGFLFGAALAAVEGIPFIPLRKYGKLPHGFTPQNEPVSYFSFQSRTEYSSESLTISTKSIKRLHDLFVLKNDPVILDSLLSENGYVCYSFEGKPLNDYSRGYVKFRNPETTTVPIKPVRVLFVDDLLATGSTVDSVIKYFDSYWHTDSVDSNIIAGAQSPMYSGIFSDQELCSLSAPMKIQVQAALSVVDINLNLAESVYRFNYNDLKSNLSHTIIGGDSYYKHVKKIPVYSLLNYPL